MSNSVPFLWVMQNLQYSFVIHCKTFLYHKFMYIVEFFEIQIWTKYHKTSTGAGATPIFTPTKRSGVWCLAIGSGMRKGFLGPLVPNGSYWWPMPRSGDVGQFFRTAGRRPRSYIDQGPGRSYIEARMSRKLFFSPSICPPA